MWRKQFWDNQRSDKSITSKALCKELQQNKLILRRVYQTNPPRVEHTLTSFVNILPPNDFNF
ncbi:winged helix-turn-helix transcriptional regulator [Pedobacter frigidisoli]|uniref:winged helix-turn-helix transcriptional regulator n=1 Tax=Pedobacter frigidisoli TaxID=2530455 RepID=UPI003977384F